MLKKNFFFLILKTIKKYFIEYIVKRVFFLSKIMPAT